MIEEIPEPIREYYDSETGQPLVRPYTVDSNYLKIHLGRIKESDVTKFAELVLLNEHWNFLDIYLKWMEEEPSKPERARLEDGTFVADDPETPENEAWVSGYTEEMYQADLSEWQSEEPVKAEPRTVDNVLAEVGYFKKVRDTTRENTIEVNGLVYDADYTAFENIKSTVRHWERMQVDKDLNELCLVDGQTIAWTLADNSVVRITYDELITVEEAITIRAALLHAQYSAKKNPL